MKLRPIICNDEPYWRREDNVIWTRDLRSSWGWMWYSSTWYL